MPSANPSPVREPRRRRLRRRLLALSLGGLLALLLAELGARVFLALRTGQLASEWGRLAAHPVPEPGSEASLGDLLRPHPDPRIIFEPIPDLDVVFEGARVTTNAHGLRGPLRQTEPQPGTVRIVALGDSVLFGWGVGDEETYLHGLQQRLDRREGRCRFETVNTGAPGYNTAMEVAVLEVKGLAYRPDIVLLDYVGNDLDLPNFLPRRVDYTTLTRSFLFELCKAVVKERAGYELRPFEAAPLVDGHFERDPDRVPEEFRDLVGLESYRRAMARLAALAREHDFEVLVTSHLEVREFVKQACAELGFPIADAGSAVAEWLARHGDPPYQGSALTVSAEDPHPSPLLHGMQAEAVWRGLLETGMLERAERKRCPD